MAIAYARSSFDTLFWHGVRRCPGDIVAESTNCGRLQQGEPGNWQPNFFPTVSLLVVEPCPGDS
jgi:hypothetical protein